MPYREPRPPQWKASHASVTGRPTAQTMAADTVLRNDFQALLCDRLLENVKRFESRTLAQSAVQVVTNLTLTSFKCIVNK